MLGLDPLYGAAEGTFVAHRRLAAWRSVTKDLLIQLLQSQQSAFAAHPPDLERRRAALASLRDILVEHDADIAAAISADFRGRSGDETRMLEILPTLDLIRHARKSLAKWMKPKPARSTWFLLPSRAYTIVQPLGVFGVMGAWNYPLYLTFGPLVSALSAGNHVMLKPSEKAPRIAELLARLIAERFPPEYVAVVTGDVDVSRQFASLPFDHLIFTGSTSVGTQIMRAASEHLTPVTLELGGKSPAIVHESFPLRLAMQRILAGKLYNAGQTCIAPDYLLVPRALEPQVEAAAREIVPSLYPTLVANADYTRIHSDAAYTRLATVLDEARASGARVLPLNPAKEPCSVDNAVFPPTLVFGAPPESRLLTDEIFGPLLPVVTYDSLDDAITYVNARPRPLALYYFDNDTRRIDRVVNRTISGGVTVNDVVYHIAQHNLP